MSAEPETTYHWLQGAILNRADGSDPKVNEVIKPNSRQSAARRLEVYQLDYFARFRSVLAMDFEAASELMGRDAWKQTIDAFAAQHPSHFKNIDHYGDRLPDFLLTRNLPNATFLRDLANLERTVSKLFSLPEEEALARDALTQLSPEDWEHAGLKVRNGLQLIQFDWPVNAWLNQFNGAKNEAKSATKETRSALPSVPKEASSEWVQIYRSGYKVWRLTLPLSRALLLQNLIQGRPLGVALEAAANAWQSDEAQFPTELQSWFGDWMEDGIFTGITRPETLQTNGH